MIGVDPGPFQLRDLVRMAKAARVDRWNHTAKLCEMIHNATHTTAKSALEFHPYAPREQAVAGSIQDLKIFVPGKKK